MRSSWFGSRPRPKSAAAEAGRIIKNTYRTLMTRGMKGCYVYCSDEETASYFRDRLSPGALAAVVEL
ncbi:MULTISPECIES: DNA/RNA helicase domain-containing protein [unclassified Variovorax]|uniref:DNA/RNA helicase domain-containing protein n=1 Tax=unclassified Variovorax TaxID=663243 RepID=UPI003F445F55